MEPASKKIRIDKHLAERSQLKPSQVSQTSNIFGAIKSTPSASEDTDEASEEAIETDSEASGIVEDDEFDVNGQSSEEGELQDDPDGDDDDEDGEGDDSDVATSKAGKRKKKSDPKDFALAMQKILSAGLTSSNRKNPILARSLESKKLDEAAEDEKLEQKVRKQMTSEKKAKLEKSHNAKVMGETDEEVARTIERERLMRKTAQKGVVRLFNAIRAAQLSAHDGDASVSVKDPRTGISVRQGAGVKKRETKAVELSKNSFLDLIKSGGRTTTST